MNRFFIAFSLVLSSIALQASERFEETLFNDWSQTFYIDEKLYEETTEEQELFIFKNNYFGKVLVLDGVIQTTEKDEFVYHEILTHTPLFSHGNAKRVLILG